MVAYYRAFQNNPTIAWRRKFRIFLAVFVISASAALISLMLFSSLFQTAFHRRLYQWQALRSWVGFEPFNDSTNFRPSALVLLSDLNSAASDAENLLKSLDIDHYTKTMNEETVAKRHRRRRNDTKTDCQKLMNSSTLGPIEVNFAEPTLAELATAHPELEPGGRWFPSRCSTGHRVAVVVPFREDAGQRRASHLTTFLNHIHPFLQRQMLDYGIYVVDQNNGSDFNRGMLLNIGFVEALERYPYKCFVFHDVDYLAADSRNFYGCADSPRHLSPESEACGFKPCYPNWMGGVNSFSKAHYELVNGFSNRYFGWGSEDEDMNTRVESNLIFFTRPPPGIGRYRTIAHVKQNESAARGEIMKTRKKRMKVDGLNSLLYNITEVQVNPLYTRLKVDIDQRLISNL